MTAVIIEDEALVALELEKMLKELAPELKVVARLETVRESVVWIRENSPDVIFSDIHLGDGNAFEIFKQVENKIPVVFVTAYDEYALQAFKSRGLDYILKPLDREEIKVVVEKLRDWLGNREREVVADSRGSYQERFLVQMGTRIKSVPVKDIAYFMADGKYLMLYTLDGAVYIVDRTMGEIEGRLDPRRFFRINRKFMIGFTAIKDMVRYSNSRVKVVLQPAPPQSIEAIVSNERVREFKEWLNR